MLNEIVPEWARHFPPIHIFLSMMTLISYVLYVVQGVKSLACPYGIALSPDDSTVYVDLVSCNIQYMRWHLSTLLIIFLHGYLQVRL